jgi:hypothetical protein
MGFTHDKKADTLAKKFGAEHDHKGVDIKIKDKAIEVAIKKGDIEKSIKQLNASRKPIKYLAVLPKKVAFAKEITNGTGIGVMSTTGNIRKRAHG